LTTPSYYAIISTVVIVVDYHYMLGVGGREWRAKMQMWHIEYKGIRQETDKAWLVDIYGKDLWLPKSLCRRDDQWIGIPVWLFKKLKLPKKLSFESHEKIIQNTT
jgi:hypothetical protein